MKPYALSVLLMALTIFGSSCATSQDSLKPTIKDTANGYALLWDVSHKQTNLDKILLIKNGTKEVEALLAEITKSYRNFEQSWIAHGFPDKQNLPPLAKILPDTELAARQSLEKEITGTILTSSGPRFNLAILMSQEKALGYTSHLIQSLIEMETLADRKKNLQQQHRVIEKLRGKTTQLLLNAGT